MSYDPIRAAYESLLVDVRNGNVPPEVATAYAQKYGLPPPPPDLVDAAKTETKDNRPNINTPEGSLTWTEGPDGRPVLTQTLSPQGQEARDAQDRVTTARSNMAEGMLGQVGNAYAQPMDWGSLGPMPDASGMYQQGADAYYNQATSRLDPMWQRREADARTQLYNQGFREGDAGYQEAMDNLSRQRNDAYGSAINQATLTGAGMGRDMFSMGMEGRQQGLAELLQQRNQPLNETNALLTGQQIGMPQMPGFNQAADYTGAAAGNYANQTGLFNYNQARQNQPDPMVDMFGRYAPYMF